MKRTTWIAWVALAVLIGAPAALAGNKGGKGKPGGGGDGGSSLPAVELVFLARHAGTNGANSYEVYSATADQSRLTRLTYDHQFLSGNLAPDPTGAVVMAKEIGSQWDPAWGKTVTKLDDGTYSLVIPPYAGSDDAQYYAAGTASGWTRQRSAGALLPYTQQRVLMTKQHRRGEAFPRVPPSEEPYGTSNLVLLSVDGTGDEWSLSDMTNTWNASTRIFVHETANAVAYIPEQPEIPDRSWVIYYTRIVRVQFSADLATYEIVDEDREYRVKTLNMNSWPSQPTELDDVAIELPLSEDAGGSSEGPWGLGEPPAFSPDGRFALITLAGSAYLVPIQFDAVYETITVPEPEATDEMLISTPSGYESRVELRAVSEDSGLAALVLFRNEKQGKGKNASVAAVRHLFVARTDGTDLTQIDVGTDGVDFAVGSFTDVVFRPSAP